MINAHTYTHTPTRTHTYTPLKICPNLSITHPAVESFQKFDPKKSCLRSVSSINAKLLQDVVACYKQVKRVCRTCYYLHRKQELLDPSKPRCKSCNKNEVIRLIPSSKMCQNEFNLSMIPVPPAPVSFMSQPNKPFEYCKKDGHPHCFEKAASNEVWYSHSLEELVIWTVERHYGESIHVLYSVPIPC